MRAGASPSQNGTDGGAPCASTTRTVPGDDAPDLPRRAAEQEDVARRRLDRPVLVDRTDERVVGLGKDAVVARLRNRAARRQRRQTRAATSPELAVDLIPVQIRGNATAPRRDAVGHELDDAIELPALQLGKRRRLAHQLEQVVLAPVLSRTLGDDLLRKDVHRQMRRVHGVERAAAHAGEQRRAFDELVARQRIQPSLRRAATAVARSTDALQECRDAARRSDLAHHLDRTDVDAQLERCGGDERAQLAGAQLRLDTLTPVPREAAVVRCNRVIAEPLRKQMRDALRHPPRVHEHERRAMRLDVRGDGVEHLAELLARRHGLQLARRQLDGDVERAPVADVDDRTARAAVRRCCARRRRRPAAARPSRSGRCVAESPIRTGRCVQRRSRRSSVIARCDPRLSRATAWISSTMIVRDRRERGATALRGDQQVQRLRRRDQEVRRPLDHCGAHRRRCVACAHLGTQCRAVRAPSPRRSRLSRRAASRGSAARRPRAPSAARRTPPASRLRPPHRAPPRGTAHRCRRGTRRASCPEPVGAAISVSWPAAICGQPCFARASDPQGTGARTRPAPPGGTHSCRSSGNDNSTIPEQMFGRAGWVRCSGSADRRGDRRHRRAAPPPA